MTPSIRIKMMDKQKNVALSGNFITVSSIRHAFLLPPDEIVQLSFETNGMQIYCEMNEAGTTFLLPDGYLTMEFLAQSARVPARPTSPMLQGFQARPVSQVENGFGWNNITSLINYNWKTRVLRITGDKMTGTCVLINERRALTAAQLGFKINETYRIRRFGNHFFSAKCEFVCTDYAILQSDDFPLRDLGKGPLEQGSHFMMGFPSDADSDPTLTKGAVERRGFSDFRFHLVEAPGWKQGYMGAPVFDQTGRIAGLLLGGTTGSSANTTGLFGNLDSSAEQKYARIIGVADIVHRHNLGPPPYALF